MTPRIVRALPAKFGKVWNLGARSHPEHDAVSEQHGIKVVLLALPERVDGLTCLVRRPDKEAVPCIVVNQRMTLDVAA